jgi:nicotinamide-nucleotide amidase
MAEGVGKAGRSTFGLAETGIAGPIRGRSPKPLGTAYIALWTPEGIRCQRFAFEGDRRRIRERIAEQALVTAANFVQDAA